MTTIDGRRTAAKAWIAAAAGVLLAACATSSAFREQAAPEGGKTGAELWAETCHRCHNYRSPASLSDAQWAVAMMHMRVRANLTGEEYRKILEFLEAGN